MNTFHKPVCGIGEGRSSINEMQSARLLKSKRVEIKWLYVSTRTLSAPLPPPPRPLFCFLNQMFTNGIANCSSKLCLLHPVHTPGCHCLARAVTIDLTSRQWNVSRRDECPSRLGPWKPPTRVPSCLRLELDKQSILRSPMLKVQKSHQMKEAWVSQSPLGDHDHLCWALSCSIQYITWGCLLRDLTLP